MRSLIASVATLLSLTAIVHGLGCQDDGSNTTCLHDDVVMMLQTTSITREAREPAFMVPKQKASNKLPSCVSAQTDLPLQQHWYTDKEGFKYKTMRYCNSCFPCSIQMALTNMGIEGESNALEEQWNKLQLAEGKPGLDAAPPDEEAVHRLMSGTGMNFAENLAAMKIISPSSFHDKASKDAFKISFPEDLKKYDAFIIGEGHARLVFRNIKAKKSKKAWSWVDPEPMHATTAKLNNEVLHEDGIHADLSSLDDDHNPMVGICGNEGWDEPGSTGFGCQWGHYILMLRSDAFDEKLQAVAKKVDRKKPGR